MKRDGPSVFEVQGLTQKAVGRELAGVVVNHDPGRLGPVCKDGREGIISSFGFWHKVPTIADGVGTPKAEDTSGQACLPIARKKLATRIVLGEYVLLAVVWNIDIMGPVPDAGHRIARTGRSPIPNLFLLRRVRRPLLEERTNVDDPLVDPLKEESEVTVEWAGRESVPNLQEDRHVRKNPGIERMVLVGHA